MSFAAIPYVLSTRSTTQTTILPPDYESPGFHVFSLNASFQYNATTFTYYDFAFNQTFYNMFSKYSASVVMDIWDCSGPNSRITQVEGNTSRQVQNFTYHGQTHIALSGWHQVSTFRGNITSESWGWMENATMDWRHGLWQPTDGFVFFHDANVILGRGELSILYIVPNPIPEFSSIAVPLFICIVIIAYNNRRKKDVQKESEK